MTQVPVLIVGGGPGGMAAAVALARHGVRSLIVERRPRPDTQPKATALSTRTMEVLRRWDLADDVRAGGVDVEWRLSVARTLREPGELIDAGFPTRAQSRLIGPEPPAAVPQDHLEAVLAGHLAALGVPLWRGVTATDLDVRPDGVRAVLHDGRTVDARYLIAADGVRGTTRHALGIGATGDGLLDEGIGVLLHAPLWEVVGDRRYVLYVTTEPAGEGVFLPAGRSDRWFWATGWRPGQPPPPGSLAEPALIERIRAGAGVPDLPVRIVRTGPTAYGTCLADRFRRDSAFLIGDAAHRVSPRGATGLNMAVQDAADLGWKLAWVLRGLAGPGLLDTYEAERRPVAVHNTIRSTDPGGSRRATATELPVDLGGRIRHRSLGDGRSTLDLAGPGFVLFVADGPARWRVDPSVEVHAVGRETARRLGIPEGAALLVRPDGLPAGRPRHPGEVAGALAAATHRDPARSPAGSPRTSIATASGHDERSITL